MCEEREVSNGSDAFHLTATHVFFQNPGVDRARILDLTLVELAKELKDGALPPETALYVYVEKALEVHKDLNCVTVFLSDCEAQLGKLRERGERGPLYGVPVSIKEHAGYKGHPSTCGVPQYLDAVEEEDSVVVKVLKKQGAIVFAKTNVPQTLICIETSNPIYGETVNPHNRAKACAGSTGGEGALIGGRGSILGIGTDIGGSIRLPSSFCGIAGFKPSPARLSLRGVRPCVDGMTAGEWTRRPNLQCRSSVTLTTGYAASCHMTPSQTSVISLLSPQLILFRPPRVDDVFGMLVKALLGDGGRTLGDKFNNSPVDSHLQDMFLLCKIPGGVKKILSFILRPLHNDFWDKLFKKAVEDGVGLPLSVQCVALPYQDELCLRLMKEVQTLHTRRQMKRSAPGRGSGTGFVGDFPSASEREKF
ncbi:PREDICTED: fatty-acid amide hydrolase 1-like [Nanorana parkeri]|uniref:fatty-acid amide hydrolase 1-like n=1 Tax=Nanorana parkeri TaxID=125878 RepID=UPI000854F601|nr:PREDICTED: fatty-acid amide hydrolase 1-like [Nanorana parkeri]